MSKPKLYLFVGYPGAGKTTVARLITQRTGAVHLWADEERQRMFGKPELDADEINKFYEELNARTAALLASGKSVVFDTNFNYRKDRDFLRNLARQQGAETVTVWLTTPVEIARLRAVETAEGKDTRVWGNMTAESFARLSDRLEAPTADEQPVEINGTNLDDADVEQLFSI